MTVHIPLLLSLAADNDNEARAHIAAGDGNAALAYGVASISSSLLALGLIQNARLEEGRNVNDRIGGLADLVQQHLGQFPVSPKPAAPAGILTEIPAPLNRLLEEVRKALPYMDGEPTLEGVIDAFLDCHRPTPTDVQETVKSLLSPVGKSTLPVRTRAMVMDPDTLEVIKAAHAAADGVSNATLKLIETAEALTSGEPTPSTTLDTLKADAAAAREANAKWVAAGQAIADHLAGSANVGPVVDFDQPTT